MDHPPPTLVRSWSSIRLPSDSDLDARVAAAARHRLAYPLGRRPMGPWVAALTRQVAAQLEAGYEMYLLTLMFRPLPPTAAARIMARTVEALYARAVTRVFRYPNSRFNLGQPLVWWGFPDYPVPKRGKLPLADVVVNDGRPLHVVALVPPVTRLVRPFDETVRRELQPHLGPEVERLRVDWITRTPDYAVEYCAKSLLRGRVDLDEVLVLPRSRHELFDAHRHPNSGRPGQLRRAPPA